MKIKVHKVGYVYNKQIFVFNSTGAPKGCRSGDFLAILTKMVSIVDSCEECKWTFGITVGKGTGARVTS